jgi:hypothetical protein
MKNLPSIFKIVQGTPPVTTTGGVTCDYVSLKNAVRAWIIAEFTQAVGHATVLGVNKATAVAPTGATAMTETQQIWVNEDTAASDTLVKATDAASETLTDDVKNKQVIMEIDPAKLAAGYDCIAATISDSSQATNFVSVTYLIETRYPQATPPAAITD